MSRRTCFVSGAHRWQTTAPTPKTATHAPKALRTPYAATTTGNRNVLTADPIRLAAMAIPMPEARRSGGKSSAASNLVYVYLPELFPTDLRASGIGIAIAASRIGSAVSTFLLPVVVAAYGVRSALGACVAVLGVGAVVCQRWAPETKHVRLDMFDQAAVSQSD